MTDAPNDFKSLLDQKPSAGTILESFSKEPVSIFLDNKPDIGQGPKRIMFANALIDDEATGWFLMESSRGLKCLILPHAQDELIAQNGGSTENLTVTRLRVVRQNNRGTALICELV